ncbi:MAG: beta-galactosidase [Mobilitalea sp.]
MMTEFGFNSNYLTKDNKPWFPIMGEMHYTRYPKKYWRESLYKMKAGGVEVVSTYAIWIHHEEIEGEYDFADNKDLRSFAEACKECGLFLMLRIGPWVHGEVRNGGFPDWLLKKGYDLRSNHPGYLGDVRLYFSKIYRQVSGLLLKDGGPIIGIQIENELGHCGGAYGEAGEQHMNTLYNLALRIGFDVPFYTATGWGGAVTGGLLPVMGGYPEAPWDQRLTEIEPSGNYIFTHERNDHNIGSDYGIGVGVTFDYAKFPYLTAELGGGMQVTHHRRPVAEAEDIGAMSLVKLGSGVNLLGYYMYHGGTNPMGKLTSLQESRETGYLNDVPVLNYDFRAPIREFGQVSDTLKEIKLFAMFAQDFGSELCKMPAIISEDNPLAPNNQNDLRYSIRHNGQSGYVFVNNYQRRYSLKEHQDVCLSVELPEEKITFPRITVKDKDYFFLPFHMIIGDAVLKTAMVTPLCILRNEKKTYLFYGDRDPKFDMKGEPGDTKLIAISRKDAWNAWKVSLRREHLIITNAAVLQTEQGIEVIGRGLLRMKVYPDFDEAPDRWVRCNKEAEFTVYVKLMKELSAKVEYSLSSETTEKKVYDIEIKLPQETTEDCFIQITYQGDRARLYLEGEFIADHFYTGRTWEVSLKRFDFASKFKLEIYPLVENAQVYLEEWPIMKAGVACELSNIEAEVEYKAMISQ